MVNQAEPVQHVNTNEPAQPIHFIHGFIVGWQVFDPPTPISPSLDDWFKVRVEVRGESIRMYIKDQLQFQEESFLKIPTGKVGFRSDGKEAALVKNVRVVVHP